MQRLIQPLQDLGHGKILEHEHSGDATFNSTIARFIHSFIHSSLFADQRWILEHEYSGDATFNSTIALPTSLSPAKWSLSPLTAASMLLVVSGIGSGANAVVLTVMIRARRQFGSSTHTLIANQSAMDLSATATAMVTSVVMLTHGYRYGGDWIADEAICIIFAGRL